MADLNNVKLTEDLENLSSKELKIALDAWTTIRDKAQNDVLKCDAIVDKITNFLHENSN